MSNFRFDKRCCQKERELEHRVKHCVRSPHRYLTQVTDHEKCVENFSNLNLRQGCPGSSRSSSDRGQNCAKQTQLCAKDARCAKDQQLCAKGQQLGAKVQQPCAKEAQPARNGHKKSAKGHRTDLCYPVPRKATSTARCKDDFVWQAAKYVKDDCGSGIVPLRVDTSDPRRIWCQTPLTMYQSTIGELARKMLCHEIVVRKRVNVGPPCNMCEHVMPMCKGYYRKYECRRNCEEDHAVIRNGKKVYRDAIQQYWMPCLTLEEKREYDLSKDADHNVYLGKKLKRKTGEKVVCW